MKTTILLATVVIVFAIVVALLIHKPEKRHEQNKNHPLSYRGDKGNPFHFTDDQWRLLTNYYVISTNKCGCIEFYGPTNRIPKTP